MEKSGRSQGISEISVEVRIFVRKSWCELRLTRRSLHLKKEWKIIQVRESIGSWNFSKSNWTSHKLYPLASSICLWKSQGKNWPKIVAILILSYIHHPVVGSMYTVWYKPYSDSLPGYLKSSEVYKNGKEGKIPKNSFKDSVASHNLNSSDLHVVQYRSVSVFQPTTDLKWVTWLVLISSSGLEYHSWEADNNQVLSFENKSRKFSCSCSVTTPYLKILEELNQWPVACSWI